MIKYLSDEDKKDICKLYKDNDIISISKKYNISEKRIKNILATNNITIRNSHLKTISQDDYIEATASRFPYHEGYKYIAILKTDQSIRFDDYLNKSGALIHYIKENIGIEIPSLFKRKKYFHENGKQWYENWFDINEVEDNKEFKKCPYCNWKTTDVLNRSGAFINHLKSEHNIDKFEYLKQFPQEKDYFKLANPTLQRQFEENKDKYVTCAICGRKMARIGTWHLKTHNITKQEYINKYGYNNLISNDFYQNCVNHITQVNINAEPKFRSKAEITIGEFIESNDIECKYSDRKILEGEEIDILIPSKNIGIEYNGLQYHSEWSGKKDKKYHYNKTINAKKKGIDLIHVFEDEYENNQELVLNKIGHILKIQKKLPKIMGRKCDIKEINNRIAKEFLDKYHIQKHSDSSIYLGAYYNNDLIGVMTFKKERKNSNEKWELTRFASDYHYVCQGVGGKLFKYFIKKYNPQEIKSFADRRWTINENNNLYIKLGFAFKGYTNINYTYINKKISRFFRIHKFNLRKERLHKKYDLPLDLTETEMAKILGYDRIWDCGLIKYVWKK